LRGIARTTARSDLWAGNVIRAMRADGGRHRKKGGAPDLGNPLFVAARGCMTTPCCDRRDSRAAFRNY
jgi:hypothetical protein